MRKFIYAATVIAALFPGVGNAFVELQGLEPNPALVGQDINLLLRSGNCDAVLGLTSVTRVGREIEIVTEGTRLISTCGLPVVTDILPLGSFPEGEYSVTVQYQFDSFGGPVTETVGVTSLIIETPQPVPVGRWWAFFLLILSVLGAGLIFLRN